jgi:hypothetical protein
MTTTTNRVRIDGIVMQHTYRSAQVGNRFMSIPRDQLTEFEAKLAEESGMRMDNHTVYEIISDGNVVYILFTDDTAVFGHSVELRRW